MLATHAEAKSGSGAKQRVDGQDQYPTLLWSFSLCPLRLFVSFSFAQPARQPLVALF